MIYSVFIFIFSILIQSAMPGDSSLTLKSRAFKKGQTIPVQYTCDGKNISPEASWSHVPHGAKSFALIIDDPDAGSTPWVHWVIFNIPANQRELKKNIPANKKLKDGAIQGANSFNKIGFDGPCPPRGPAHQYVMKLYALDTKLDLKGSSTKAQVVRAMENHILEKAVLKAKYKRR